MQVEEKVEPKVLYDLLTGESVKKEKQRAKMMKVIIGHASDGMKERRFISNSGKTSKWMKFLNYILTFIWLCCLVILAIMFAKTMFMLPSISKIFGVDNTDDQYHTANTRFIYAAMFSNLSRLNDHKRREKEDMTTIEPKLDLQMLKELNVSLNKYLLHRLNKLAEAEAQVKEIQKGNLKKELEKGTETAKVDGDKERDEKEASEVTSDIVNISAKKAHSRILDAIKERKIKESFVMNTTHITSAEGDLKKEDVNNVSDGSFKEMDEPLLKVLDLKQETVTNNAKHGNGGK